MSYKPTIGLEIHVELNTKSKMFCSCKNDPNEKIPNKNICPICVAHPGTLPVINEEAVKKVIKTAMAVNCSINKKTFFERKNYFYPDLPKGYQISQYLVPLSYDGFLEVETERPGEKKKIRIERIHLEEDTGRLIHSGDKKYSLVDYNRAGIPLMELVTKPDISSSVEAKSFASNFQLILRYLGISNADMEKGEMRVEVNISVKKEGDGDNKLGTKVEIKNLNSIRAVEGSIAHEIKRQIEVLEGGGKVVQETRGWDDKREVTFSQRKKEEAHDYRYFPEPDLPPLEIDDKFLEEIKNEISELPQQRLERFKKEYFLTEKEAKNYVNQKDLGDFFEKVVSELREWVKEKDLKDKITEDEFKKLIKLASNYISTDLQAFLVREKISVTSPEFLIDPENFAEFLTLIYKGEISSKIAKIILKEMFEKGGDPTHIIEAKGLKLIESESDLEKFARQVVEENKQAVEDYKKGKQTALQFLIGKLMAATQGKANPEMAKKVLEKILN